MIFADLSLSTETAVAVFAVVSTLGTVIAFLFGIVVALYKAANARLESEIKSWKEIALEANDTLGMFAKKHQQETGSAIVVPVAAVVPEHSSPPSHNQIRNAELQTERARLTAATLALGLPARGPGV